MIGQYLDLSTAHLSPADADALATRFADCVYFTPRVIEHTYGWWLNVRELDDQEARDEERQLAGDYPHLAVVLAYARGAGCTWINFDADGATLPDLPTFD